MAALNRQTEEKSIAQHIVRETKNKPQKIKCPVNGAWRRNTINTVSLILLLYFWTGSGDFIW